MIALVNLIAILLGLAFGSFANVVIFRGADQFSKLNPPSSCLMCGMHIVPRDNIPVISWLLLRGKCRNCGAKISTIYPVVEIISASLFLLFVNFPRSIANAMDPAELASGVALTVALWVLSFSGITLAAIDSRELRLPNRLVYSTFFIGGTCLAISSVVVGDWDAVVRAILGAMVSLAIYGAIVFVSPRGMGIGDLKLSAVLGLYLGWFGWGALFMGLLFAFLLGAGFGLVLISRNRASVQSTIPFGPWMIAGAFLSIFFGTQLWGSYLDFLQRVIV